MDLNQQKKKRNETISDTCEQKELEEYKGRAN